MFMLQVARPARPGTYRELARYLRLTGGRKGSYLFVSYMNPVNFLPLTQRLGQAVQAVSDHAEDALYPGLDQCFRDEVGNVIDLHEAYPVVDI
jgi:hypothetical protein